MHIPRLNLLLAKFTYFRNTTYVHPGERTWSVATPGTANPAPTNNILQPAITYPGLG